ncbi:MAG: VOC family protein [Alphaproteobacteria bacterium]|nr:VOC family protein [Alphaproteobacteria bacterium]
MTIFNHIQIKVKDLTESRKFYDKIMDALGHSIVLEIKDTVIGYGTSVHDMFEIRQANSGNILSESVHIAFNAASRKDVECFYKTAIKNGAQCNGPPGLRPQYEKGYYAAFVIDNDGHNIEAIYKGKKE